MLPCSIYQNILSCAISYKNWYIWISNYIFLRRLTSLGRKQTILLPLSSPTTVYSTPMTTQSPGMLPFVSYLFISYHISTYLIISLTNVYSTPLTTRSPGISSSSSYLFIYQHISSYLNMSQHISSYLIALCVKQWKLRKSKFQKVKIYFMLIFERKQVNIFSNGEKLPKFCKKYFVKEKI